MIKKYICKYIDIFPKNNRRVCIYLFLTLSVWCSECFAQGRTDVYTAYIEQYSDLAVKHREKYGIPASITLAQGLLESAAGTSELAKKANNHFGIKCGGAWTGKSVKHKAERGKECFRKYDNAEQSYEDHARFLKRKRYEPLYKYKVTDYKNWAKTLRKCGYATDSKYPEKLIKIIERYELYRFDEGKERETVDKEKEETVGQERDINSHVVHRRGRLNFVRTREGDTYAAIAQEFGLKKKKLMEFNDVKGGNPLKTGTIVYLQKKDKKNSGKEKYHVVKEGETLYSISQEWGIRLKSLLKMNRMKAGDIINPGDTLRIK